MKSDIFGYLSSSGKPKRAKDATEVDTKKGDTNKDAKDTKKG